MTPDELAKLIPAEVWQELVNEVHRITGIDIDDEEARAAIAAALAAWPGMQDGVFPMDDGMYREIILPLPQKEQQ